jgi:hypothetical protein
LCSSSLQGISKETTDSSHILPSWISDEWLAYLLRNSVIPNVTLNQKTFFPEEVYHVFLPFLRENVGIVA